MWGNEPAAGWTGDGTEEGERKNEKKINRNQNKHIKRYAQENIMERNKVYHQIYLPATNNN